uniref:Uncharacterized protein n=1 Tax=Anguilla anguilla TaxID=7936 RepID=A0A0E9VGE6_ANGAN
MFKYVTSMLRTAGMSKHNMPNITLSLCPKFVPLPNTTLCTFSEGTAPAWH